MKEKDEYGLDSIVKKLTPKEKKQIRGIEDFNKLKKAIAPGGTVIGSAIKAIKNKKKKTIKKSRGGMINGNDLVASYYDKG